MRHVILKEFGGPENLVAGMGDDLAAGPGQLLVDVEAAGVNFLDVTQRGGVSRVHNVSLPLVPGLEGVGRIRALGPGVSAETGGLVAGDRVAWFDVPGSYADQALVPAARAVPVPDSLPFHEALLFQPLTAQYLVHEYRDVRPGNRVLVHAAAGGVGQLLVQWLKHLGAWVVGTASSEEKAAAVRALGADAAIAYGEDYGFLDGVMELTGGRGVHLAFDGIGARTLVDTLGALGPSGTAVSIGAASGPAPPIDPRMLTQRGLRLAGGSVFTYNADPAELRRRAAKVLAAVQAGWLRPDRGTAYPLERAADAHRDMEGRRTRGKLYLTP